MIQSRVKARGSPGWIRVPVATNATKNYRIFDLYPRTMSNQLHAPCFLMGAVVGMTATLLATVSWNRCREHLRPAPRRHGGAIRLRPEYYDRYTQLHDSIWEGVLQRMYKSNIRNFTLYYHKETHTLFSHFEWIGHWQCTSADDEEALFHADMRAVAEDPVVRQWWAECEPCQEPFSQWAGKGLRPPSQGGSDGDWWAPLLCLGHCGHWPTRYSPHNRDPSFIPQNRHGKISLQPKVE